MSFKIFSHKLTARKQKKHCTRFSSKLFKVSTTSVIWPEKHVKHASESENLRGSGLSQLPLLSKQSPSRLTPHCSVRVSEASSGGPRGAFGLYPPPPKANHGGQYVFWPPKPKPGPLDLIGPLYLAEVDFLSGFRAPGGTDQGPAGSTRALQNEPGPPRGMGSARRIRAHNSQDRSGPRKTNQEHAGQSRDPRDG